MLAVSCPKCNAAVEVADRELGMVVECNCGHWFKSTPEPIPLRELDAPVGQFSCPFCKCSEVPRHTTAVMRLGWWLCFGLAASCVGLPVCWVPLLIFREEINKCAYCGMRLDYPRPWTW